MSTPLAKMRARFGENIGVELFFAFPENQADEKTYLDADSAAGVSTVSAESVNFNANDYVIIGRPGSERTEIAQVSTATATAMNFASALLFAHSRGDMIQFISYNQIVAEFSSNGGTSFTAMSAVNIRPDATETYMQRSTDLSTYIYRFRFSNSTTSILSAYSDNCPANGYADNTIWSVKARALGQLGEVRGDLITDQFLNDSIQEARRQADQNPEVFRWSFRTKFGAVFSQMLAGQWQASAPTDLRDRNSKKNILSIRIGNQNRPVVFQDRVRFNQNYLNVVHTTVGTAYTAGGTSLILSSTHDLGTTGSITIANDAYGQTLVAIPYTANNRATNTLTIAGSAIGRNLATGLDIWGSTAVFGLPTGYTIDAGVISLDVPLKIDYDGMDIKGDYYTVIPAIATDDQPFDEPFYDLYVYWLKWKIKSLKANGKLDRNSDPDYQDWQGGLVNLIAQEFPGQTINFIPDVEGFLSATE